MLEFVVMGYFRFLRLSTKGKFRFLSMTSLCVVDSISSFIVGGVVPSSVLFVYCRWNNIHLSLVSLGGVTVFKVRSGCIGLKGSRRKSPYRGHRLGLFVAQKAISLGYNVVYLFIKFFGKARFGVAKGISCESRFLVLGVLEVSSLPYNGCRVRKVRRL